MKIFDRLGKEVRTLTTDCPVAGVQTQNIDGFDNEGRTLASGVYYVILERDGNFVNKFSFVVVR